MEKKDGTSREALVNYLGEVKTQKVLDNLLTIDLIESDESGKLHLKNKNFSTSGSAAAILSIIRHITLSCQ
jgi:hypothetical protein